MIKALLLAASLIFATPVYASSIKEVGAATYQLYVDGEFTCSGTFISKTEMLTAAHCIPQKDDHNYSIKVDVRKNQQIISSRTVYLDLRSTARPNDVAVLTLLDEHSGLEIVPIDLASVEETNKVLEFGTKVISVGYPLNTGELISEGLYSVTGWSKDKASLIDGLFYKTSLNIMPGSSGGGLYTEIGGTWKLIGTAYGLDEYISGMFATPVSFMSYFSTIESIHNLP